MADFLSQMVKHEVCCCNFVVVIVVVVVVVIVQFCFGFLVVVFCSCYSNNCS